ncbi:hypothetical protein FO519_001989 [Halicephalobus sp. NKZ332]|nr:hypothetical protein FO519_001989 [Halicephalobus sp. NKZ332]
MGESFGMPEAIVPSAKEWMNEMSSTDRMLLITSTISTVVVLIFGLIEQVFVSKYISSEAVKHYLSWIVFILPITTTVSVVGMYFPRSAMFMNILGECYSMICLTVIIRLMNHLFGSRREIVRYMNEEGFKIDPNCAPFFPCFCHCLPKIQPTTWRIRFVEWLIYQTSFVRIITGVAVMIGLLEDIHGVNVVENATNGINTASVLLSIYGCEMLKKVGEEHLKKEKFAHIYIFLDVTQTIFTLQGVFTDLLMKFHVFNVGVIGTVEARSQYLASFGYCMEALVLSIVSLFIFNPVGNALFDRYVTRESRRNEEGNFQMEPLKTS